MSQSNTTSRTDTYSVADVETAFKRFRADILMIADSTKAITRDKALEYAHDAEYLAKLGFLAKVDVTLLSSGVEKRAAAYIMSDNGSELEASRPGGVLWPQLASAEIRVILSYTKKYTNVEKANHRNKLKIGWVPSYANTSHATLTANGGRNYPVNNFGIVRSDFL